MMMSVKPLVLTMGEPSGVGGEIALAAWRRLHRDGPPFVLLDDVERLRSLSRALDLGVPVATVADPHEAVGQFKQALPVMQLSQSVPLALGRPDPNTAPAVIESIERAVALTRGGSAAGVVTNPIHKGVLQAAGFPHPGHTEFLGSLAGVDRTVMMLVGGDLRVVPATIHIPLADVPGALTVELIVETATILMRALRTDFRIPAPRISVAGLNPHAGEGGLMGREEADVIVPALAALRSRGMDLIGPLSADTLFHSRARRTYDAALCMYHDQALIPVKTIAFDEGVNVTLGLPFVRTSPDHGTALDIAGRGIARPGSLIAALLLAAELSGQRLQVS